LKNSKAQIAFLNITINPSTTPLPRKPMTGVSCSHLGWGRQMSKALAWIRTSQTCVPPPRGVLTTLDLRLFRSRQPSHQ